MQSILETTHDQMISALKGIKSGKGPNDSVSVPPFGTRIRVYEALNNACNVLKEAFHADHIDLVDSAFWRTGHLRPSDRIDECAVALLDILISNRAELRGPSEAAFEHRYSTHGVYDRLRDGKKLKWFARYTSEYPRTWEARGFFVDDKPYDVWKDEPRERFSGVLIDIPMPVSFLRSLTHEMIERSIEECEIL